jgi:hypothetical protein
MLRYKILKVLKLHKIVAPPPKLLSLCFHRARCASPSPGHDKAQTCHELHAAVFIAVLQFRYAFNGRVIGNAFQDSPINTISAFKSGDLAGHAIFFASIYPPLQIFIIQEYSGSYDEIEHHRS